MIDAVFIRMAYIKPMLKGVASKYHIDKSALGIPESLYQDEMALIPHMKVNRWFESLSTLCGNPNFPFAIASYLTINQIDLRVNWFMSAPDLAITFRRINYGLNCFHSGATYVGSQSGNILKWCYHNPHTTGVSNCIDSLRVAIMFTQVLRHFTSQGYAPLRVCLSGSDIDREQAELWFGCPVQLGSNPGRPHECLVFRHLTKAST